MEKELVTSCPRCREKLTATKLTCRFCDLEMNGDFVLGKFDYLSSSELDFIECFLMNEGNFKAVQCEKGMSYPAAKKKIADILDKLNLKSKRDLERNDEVKQQIGGAPITPNDSLVIRRIKEKLNASCGKASIQLFSGEECDIRYCENGNGLASSKIPPANQLIWSAFDAAVEIVLKNGGKAKKGNAQSGAKLGTDKLTLDSVEGYIAHKVHGVHPGETAFGPGFVICAVLDWAEICSNERGWLVIKPEFASSLIAN